LEKGRLWRTEVSLFVLFCFSQPTNLSPSFIFIFILFLGLGYVAPELIESFGSTTEKSAVYSLGVVLGELLTGRAPATLNSVNPANPPELLATFIRQTPLKNGDKIVDDLVADRWPTASWQKLAQISRHCLEESPAFRPTLYQVTELLGELLAVPQAHCVVCLDSRSTARPPCGHQVTCHPCLTYLEDCGLGCPMCSAPLSEGNPEVEV